MTSGEGQSGDCDTAICTPGSENESVASPPPPAPPANSPQTMSEAGGVGSLDLAMANAMLGEGAGGDPTPPPSEVDGKAHLRDDVRSDMPLLKQLFKQPPKPVKMGKMKVTRRLLEAANPSLRKSKHKNTSPPNEHTHEASIWHEIAIEDVTNAIKRMGTAAKDMHKLDDSKTVEEYYSETLADIINKGEIKFDPKYLQ